MADSAESTDRAVTAPVIAHDVAGERPTLVLRDVYGYEAFRGDQEAVIAAVLDGRDALVLMPTGGGKSLCYQIPALLRPGVALVVSPLIALMQDQVAALELLGVNAAYINSSQSRHEQNAVIRRLTAGELDLLYIAPERLLQPETLELLAGLPVALIAIDEAHCVSQWGHDFREDYLALDVLKTRFPGVPRLALTATADERTRREIVIRLALDSPEIFVGSFDRENIRYLVQTKTEPRRQLLGFMAGHRGEAGIVYCLSRRKVESTAELLVAEGYDALPYHAGLPGERRAAHQRRFLREDGVVIVATIAFGMGIDKPDVRFVAHLDLPKSVESYYQETGRAGRDGAPAEAWMIYGLQDVVRLRRMADESEAGESHKRSERERLDALLGWCEVTTCRRRSLLGYFGESYERDCGNCDVCLSPPETWDATDAARKFLSCVYRTGQRFGAAHLVDVLLGRDTAKVRQHRHASLSVYGIGAEHSERRWRSIARQLVVRGYLSSDPDGHGGLVLAESARPLLRGEVTLELREDRTPAKRSRRSETPAPAGPVDEALWEALRACRKRLAEENNVPAYVIFHDKTLREMAERKPDDPQALLEITGVGQAKLERYGDRFLDVLRAAD